MVNFADHPNRLASVQAEIESRGYIVLDLSILQDLGDEICNNDSDFVELADAFVTQFSWIDGYEMHWLYNAITLKGPIVKPS